MNTSESPESERTGAPRWLVMLVIGVLLVALVAVAVMLVGGGHKPRLHGAPSSSSMATFP